MAREVATIVDLRRLLGDRLVLCRKAAGLTQAQLAERLYCDRTKVAHVEKGRAGADERFWRTADDVLSAGGVLVRDASAVREARQRHDSDRRVADRDAARQRLRDESSREDVGANLTDGWSDELRGAAEWLDERAGWPVGRACRLVAHQERQRHPRSGLHHSAVSRSVVADELLRYYAVSGDNGVRAFAPSVDDRALRTCVVSSAEWTSLCCPLNTSADRSAMRTAGPVATPFDDLRASAAVRRIADARQRRTRIADLPLYRLLDVNVGRGALSSVFGVATFLEYALTLDLLERELHDVIAATPEAVSGRLPLRDSFLPDLPSVLDVSGRLCAGGVLSLCAIRRPADPARGLADYVLLVQQRSHDVLNANDTLAVIPKGVHAPLVDYRSDVRIGMTLRRELEEELFGRGDVDGTEQPQRAADPMHPARLSGPMRWLTEEPARIRMECTGFGLNLVSGNYEFACLTVIEDEEFWTRFGGAVVANWETSSLRQVSTLDGDLLAELAADERWSNEGLFAFVLGLRRMQQLHPDRVAPIPIGWNPS